jgi:hypothetical protein
MKMFETFSARYDLRRVYYGEKAGTTKNLMGGFATLGLQGSFTPPVTEGARAVGPYLLNVTAASQAFNLRTLQTTQNLLSFAATMYVDNSANAGPVTFMFSSGQKISVAAGVMEYIPIFQPNPVQFTYNTSGAAGVCNVMFCNFLIQGHRVYP